MFCTCDNQAVTWLLQIAIWSGFFIGFALSILITGMFFVINMGEPILDWQRRRRYKKYYAEKDNNA